MRSVDKWLRAPELAQHETLDAAAVEREAMWLGLRLIDGIERARHLRQHGVDPVEHHAREIEKLVHEGLIGVTPEKLRLTRKGVLFADEVAQRFL